MRERLLEILADVKPGFDFEGKSGLIDNGDLDSFDRLSLLSALNDGFGIDIPVEELTAEDFDSVDTMLELLQSLIEE